MLTIPEAAALLRSYDNVLILTHVRPDGDTVGCAAGLCAALRALGKTAYLSPNPEITSLTAPYFQPYAAPDGFAPDRVVSVDIATPALIPDNAQRYADRIDLALDHHPSFEHFGKHNLVRPTSAACGELLYDIIACLGPVTPEIALPLYVAVATDTGCFAYNNTTARTHAVAAALMNTGIDFLTVNKRFFRTKTRKRLALEAAMLSAIEYHDEGRIAVLAVPLDLIERIGADDSDTDDLAALGGSIEGVDCAVTMRERKPGVWRISLRTNPQAVNATRACSLLGGGGHAAAGGCTVETTFEDAKLRILAAIAQTASE
ncbi:MAG: phosphoesterase RecJ domain-containing protein [Oscillibacter sp.]|nr:phosphoesterase RecJ domain-containing protein [Oscillibacter sp.]